MGTYGTYDTAEGGEGIRSAVDTKLGNGYVTIRESSYNNRALALTTFVAGDISVKTFEMVSELGADVNANYFIMHGFYPLIAKNADDGTFYISKNGTNRKFVHIPNTVKIECTPVSYTDVTTLTYTMDDVEVTDGTDTYKGTLSMYNGAKTLMSAPYKLGEKGYGAGFYIGFTHSLDNAKLYAARYYSKVLSDLERAQNHFADIAKFFRLDISEIAEKLGDLSDEQAKGYYAAFAEVTVTSSRNDVVAVFDAANAAID